MDADALIASLQARGCRRRALEARAERRSADHDLRAARGGAGAGRALRDRPELAFTFLAELTAVDFWPREPRFEVVYLLVSIEHRQRLRLKVRLPGDDAARADGAAASGRPPTGSSARCGTCSGSSFDGHPDLRRLLMPEDWEGYPLRKDYPVQIRMTPQRRPRRCRSPRRSSAPNRR